MITPEERPPLTATEVRERFEEMRNRPPAPNPELDALVSDVYRVTMDVMQKLKQKATP